jgi:hypothetical protein
MTTPPLEGVAQKSEDDPYATKEARNVMQAPPVINDHHSNLGATVSDIFR